MALRARSIVQSFNRSIVQCICFLFLFVMLPEILSHVDGNQAQASEILGIARSTLRTKITDLGLTSEKRLKAENGRDF